MSLVDIPTRADTGDFYDQHTVVDGIQNPVMSHSDTKPLPAPQIYMPIWIRILAKRTDRIHDLTIELRVTLFNLPELFCRPFS